MSSSEPCYSWNLFVRFLRDERDKFLEGFYSLSAGSVSRRFLGGVEYRDGIQALPVTNAVIDTHLRNMLVFENENARGIDLLRNSPSRWLGKGESIKVTGAQTYYGVLNFSAKMNEEGQLVLEIDAPSRDPVDWVRVHVYHPGNLPVAKARLTGSSGNCTSSDNLVEIPNPRGHMRLVVEFKM